MLAGNDKAVGPLCHSIGDARGSFETAETAPHPGAGAYLYCADACRMNASEAHSVLPICH